MTNLTLLLPLLSAGLSSQNDEKPLNIIYIMTDDHSYQTLSAYDKRYINTPNLDRIAAEGALFSNSFVANSISGPSRACLLTGKHSHMNGMKTNATAFDGSQMTFPKLLQKAGYETAMIGKWHLVSTPTGFDHWTILPGQGSYYNPEFITPDGREKIEGYVTNIITDLGIDYLENRDSNKPFCMLLHHKAVHRTWFSDTPFLEEFEDVTFPIPLNYWDDYKGRQAAAVQKMSVIKDMDLAYDLKMNDPEIITPYKSYGTEVNRMTKEQRAAWEAVYNPLIAQFKAANLSGRELAEWKYQRYMRDYLKCVMSLDDNIGRLMRYLENEGLLENTIIVYASDQGFYMGEHGWFDKRFMYEESVKTPLLVRYPDSWKDVKRGAKIEQMVQNIDYAPTFLQIAGVDVPEGIQGESLLPLLKGQKLTNWRKSIYYHYYEYPDEHNVHRHYGVRTERYKLIHFYDNGIDQWEMYDLKTDSMEMNNIYDIKRYSKIQANLHAELYRLRDHYKVITK